MSYSEDLRRKVLEFVNQGHSQQEAAQVFQVNRSTIYRWQRRPSLAPSFAKTRQRRLVKADVLALVEAQSNARLRDYAEQLGVSPVAIWKAFKRWGVSQKNDPLHGKKVYITD